LGFSKIYVLRESGGTRAFRGKIFVDDPFAVTRGEIPVDRAEVRWAMGSGIPSDIVRTTFAAPVIAHERVVRLLEDGGFSGWKTYPVQLFGKDGAPISGYHGLSVHGRCGPIENDRSETVDRTFPARVSPVWRGLYFDPTTWDGSDVFMPAGKVGWIFAVEAVKRAFAKAKVKNVVFTRLDQFERRKL
jgi:hypothetical protein